MTTTEDDIISDSLGDEEVEQVASGLVGSIESDVEDIGGFSDDVRDYLTSEIAEILQRQQSNQLGSADSDALITEVLAGTGSITELAGATLDKYESLASIGDPAALSEGVQIVRAKADELEAKLAELLDQDRINETELEVVRAQILAARADATQRALDSIERTLELANLAAEAEGDDRQSSELGRRINAYRQQLDELTGDNVDDSKQASQIAEITSRLTIAQRQQRDARISDRRPVPGTRIMSP